MPRGVRKRKRSNGFSRAAKRFKAKRGFRRGRKLFKKRFSGKAPRSISKPPFFRHLSPRIRTVHTNQISVPITNLSSAFTTSTSVRIRPNVLRDPEFDTAFQAFPENFVMMAGLYESYRVLGFKLTVTWNQHTNNENDKFISCLYTRPADNGAQDPYSDLVIVDQLTRDAFLQEDTGIKKKLITDSGTGFGTTNKKITHSTGYISIAGMENKRRIDMPDAQYTGKVSASGGVIFDPVKQPILFIRGVSPHYTGYTAGGASPMTCAIRITFFVEWFDRREALELIRSET